MVKAGTIHAIGAGILICEIQQNSNCTYRMYDYDRRDKFGNKRELHVDKALDVVDTKRYVPYESSINAYDEATNEAAATIEEDSSEGQLLVSCKYFECYKYDISDSVSINVDTAYFRSVIFTEGCGTIRVGEDVKAYKVGDSFYITAGNKTVEIEGNCVAIVTKVCGCQFVTERTRVVRAAVVDEQDLQIGGRTGQGAVHRAAQRGRGPVAGDDDGNAHECSSCKMLS